MNKSEKKIIAKALNYCIGRNFFSDADILKMLKLLERLENENRVDKSAVRNLRRS